jgi:hypothetical protein
MDNLEDIVDAIDVARVGTPLANFYVERGEVLSSQLTRRRLLDQIKDVVGPCTGYAFHCGGRGELQLNIGFEKERSSFRYGAAFSIEGSRDLTDPVRTLEPFIQRFNELLGRFPELHELQMWVVDKHLPAGERRTNEGTLRRISDDLVREGTFIFFGQSVPVGPGGIEPEAITHATAVLNAIYPLYLAVIDGSGRSLRPLEQKVARLCWNGNMWISPSGHLGKSRNKDTFENKHGFGHEEWLFDTGRLLEGFKYGFIQPMNGNHSAYVNRRLGLLLYTIDGRTSERYWVGAIDEVQSLSPRQAALAAREFRKAGWLREMEDQVEAMNLARGGVSDTGNTELFNVRFRPESLRVFEPPIPFDADDVPSDYYNILQSVPDSWLHLLTPDAEEDPSRPYNQAVTQTTRKPYEGGVVDLLQMEWQNKLDLSLLADLPSGVKPQREARVGRFKVDYRLRGLNRTVFVELKPRGTARSVIRDALAQLLDYAYWPTASRCDTLLIVGPSAAGKEDLAYLATLRQRFGIPVHYLHYRDGRIVGIANWYLGLLV